MWNTLKLLVLLSTLHVAASHLTRRRGGPAMRMLCPEGQYNFRGAGFCFNCTTCAEFLYEQEKCTETRNTVCGWCGKEPNFAEISDTVLASYQTKCMMSRLDFVDMGQLKEELEEEEEFEESGEDESINTLEIFESSEFSSGSSNEENDYVHSYLVKIVKKPIAEADVLASDEVEELSGEPEPETKVFSESEENEEGETEGDSESAENEMDSEVSESVNAYLIQKSKKVEPEENENTPEFAFISRDEVEASLKHLVELVPVQRPSSGEQEYDSDEDSNERVIKWDKWVDDEVKPIREDTEVVEAEEIQKETYIIVNEEFENDGDMEYQYNKNAFIFSVVQKIMMCLGIVIFVTLLAIARNQMRAERRAFYGVPTDSQDYHMIVEASRHIEELEKKEKHAARHIHDNPVFDI